jgi:hypothetical protein
LAVLKDLAYTRVEVVVVDLPLEKKKALSRGEKHETSDDEIPAAACGPKRPCNSPHPLPPVKACHHQAQLVEKSTGPF